MSWAFAPAIGVGLAAHELEHHGLQPADHSHAALVATAIVHGHFHEEEADEHDHGVALPSFSAARLYTDSNLALAQSAAVALSPSCPPVDLPGQSPEQAGLSPPSPFALCVLRL